MFHSCLAKTNRFSILRSSCFSSSKVSVLSYFNQYEREILKNRKVVASLSTIKGYGLLACRDIKRDDVILSINSKLWMPYSSDAAIKYGFIY